MGVTLHKYQLRKGDFEEVDERHIQTYGLEGSFDEPMMYWDIDFMRYIDGEIVENEDILELAGIKKEWLDHDESYALELIFPAENEVAQFGLLLFF